MIDPDVRSRMVQMMVGFGPKPTVGPSPPPPTAAMTLRPVAPETPAPVPFGISPHFSSLVPSMISLKGQILQELHTNLGKLLTLNPSRREAIATYLDQVARHAPAPSVLRGQGDPAGGLRRWLEGPRTPAQGSALQTYFEEVALVFLGQAILLKSWSDRALRRFTAEDLGRLNWALSTSLKPNLPLDRDGWQLTRPNFYSWYHPSLFIQQELWNTLSTCDLGQDGSGLLAALLIPTRPLGGERPDGQGYDPRFFKALWQFTSQLPNTLPPPAPGLKRERYFFTPTLRDGTLARTGPQGSPGQPIAWIGTEPSAFQLIVAELMQLWPGPAAPPLWSVGNGLEVHARDQMSLALGSPKPSLVSRIAEIESCDAAVVLEERMVRSQGRGCPAQRLREQLDGLPYFKRLRGAGTSLGDLQACVALNKLRPGGALWWAREEALGSGDGAEVLSFLLDRGKLVCAWDFSGIDHQLPGTVPLFPKYLYLFLREPRIEERLSHRPLAVTLRGQIRSHVELPLILEDALAAGSPNAAARASPPPRGHWQIHALRSPSCQKEWSERWPDPTSQVLVQSLERLRLASMPMATATTVRPTPEGNPERAGAWSVDPALTGLWISAERGAEGRTLAVHPLSGATEHQGSGFLVLIADPTWIAPLSAYLKSEIVRDWLDQNAERRQDRWVLVDQVVRFLPVPTALLGALGVNPPRLPAEWARRVLEAPHQPREVCEALARLPETSETDRAEARAVRAEIFVQAARAAAQLGSGQSNLGSMISAGGRVCWAKVLDILPPQECVAVSVHPEVTLNGNLPPHVPIARVERVKAPAPGILFATELGPFLRICSDSSVVLDMIWSQVEGVTHPTWNELFRHIRLPRRTELAQATASDLLRLHGEQTQRLHELLTLISACTLY